MTQDHGRLPAAYGRPGSASFVEFVAEHAPHLLPSGTRGEGAVDGVPHGTTIVAATCDGGVVMAGDRRATAGTHIASRDIEKVFAADENAVVGIAGSAGLAIELVRLFQLELEHYEKIEGRSLSFDGQANRLGTMLRSQLGLALRGLAVVPLLAGFDRDARGGRIVSYDVTGGRYEEREHHAIGSGAAYARGSLKKRWRRGLDVGSAITVVVEALVDAADDDAATGGPDALRDIWPVVMVVTDAGVERVADDVLARVTSAVVSERREARA